MPNFFQTDSNSIVANRIKRYIESIYIIREYRKNAAEWHALTRARFLDDGAVARDVPILVLHPAVVPVFAICLRRRGRRHAGGRGDADNGAVLFVLLPGL